MATLSEAKKAADALNQVMAREEFSSIKAGFHINDNRGDETWIVIGNGNDYSLTMLYEVDRTSAKALQHFSENFSVHKLEQNSRHEGFNRIEQGLLGVSADKINAIPDQIVQYESSQQAIKQQAIRQQQDTQAKAPQTTISFENHKADQNSAKDKLQFLRGVYNEIFLANKWGQGILGKKLPATMKKINSILASHDGLLKQHNQEGQLTGNQINQVNNLFNKVHTVLEKKHSSLDKDTKKIFGRTRTQTENFYREKLETAKEITAKEQETGTTKQSAEGDNGKLEDNTASTSPRAAGS